MPKRKQKAKKTLGLKIKIWLSHHPYLYALFGGTGVILFWRGTWHTFDFMTEIATSWPRTNIVAFNSGWWDGPLSLALGAIVLSITGIFISSLVGNEIIIAGLKTEKRLEQKESKIIHDESKEINDIRKVLDQVLTKLDHLEEHSTQRNIL